MSLVKNIEIKGKKLLFLTLKLLLGKQKPNVQKPGQADIHKMLIIRIDRKVGNLILSLPLIEAFRSVFPNSEIFLLLSRESEKIIRNNPYVRGIFVFNHKRYFRNPFALIKLLRELKKRRFELVIDSGNPGSASVTSCMLAYASGAQYRAGFENKYSEIFMNMLVKADFTKHYSDMQLDLVRIFKEDFPLSKADLYLSENEREEAIKIFSRYKDKNLVGIWFGGAEEKRWKFENFMKLKNKIEENINAKVYLFFGTGENGYARKVKDDYPGIELTKFTDVRKLAACIEHLDVFICGDTGPLHIAYAVNTPSVGVFLHKNYVHYGYSEENKYYTLYIAGNNNEVDKVYSKVRLILDEDS